MPRILIRALLGILQRLERPFLRGGVRPRLPDAVPGFGLCGSRLWCASRRAEDAFQDGEDFPAIAGPRRPSRGDIAFAQSCLETGNFTFSGSAVTLSQNNFCGMGVTSNGMKGNSFGTPQLGIRAQVQHLKAYASTDALKNACIDPRFKYVTRGCAEYAEWLGQKENPAGKGWAAGAGYGGAKPFYPAGVIKRNPPCVGF